MKNILLIDTHFLAHRAYHTTKNLSWKEKPTGVIFGVLKTIQSLMLLFSPTSIVFCFESPKLLRKEIFPDYKKKRVVTDQTPEEQKARNEFYQQIDKLRTEYLPAIGFKNVFQVPGYESDDLMALICKQILPGDSCTMVTADHDMFQCLRDGIIMYNPSTREITTEWKFTKKYGITPRQWAVVKAVSGCDGDGVPGIKGVGEITAIKYVKRTLPEDSKAYKAILCSEGRATVRRNRKLVQLPYEGCKVPAIKPDRILGTNWNKTCIQLGLMSVLK